MDNRHSMGRTSGSLGAHGQPQPLHTEVFTQSSALKSIMVIGSTGFLGPYIVASLMSNNTLSEVFCVNRSEDGAERTMLSLQKLGCRVQSNGVRLRFFVADISRPGFGLSGTQVEDLTVKVDAVVFNAWNPDWRLPLEKFQCLLDGLQNVINFCVSSTKAPRITFISSICAIGEWPRRHPERPTIPEEITHDSDDAMVHGYGKSKWNAELLLERASISSGLHVAIIRPGLVGGPALSSVSSDLWPIQGWIYSIIKESRKKGYWPTHVQPLDWIPVDVLAGGIATVTISQQIEKTISVYNMVHPSPVSWGLLLETLRERYGLAVQELSLPKWLALFRPGELKLYEFLNVAGCGREYDMICETKNASKFLPDVAAITVDQLELWLTGWDLRSGDKKAKL